MDTNESNSKPCWLFTPHSYTPCTLCACYSQSKFKILKIHDFQMGNYILLAIFKWLLNLPKCLIYDIIKDKKVCLPRVWTRLTTVYLLCAREFRQNNALVLQFWCSSNALTLRVLALDASKSQRACIILSKFTRKSKYAFINL